MAGSGIAVDQDCATAFQALKLQKSYHFIIFKMDASMKKVVVTHKEGKAPGDNFKEKYDEFVRLLGQIEREKQCAYAVVDAVYKKGDAAPKNKILFYIYCPDTSDPKLKMPYASTKGTLKTALKDGIAFEVQANDADDISWSTIEKMLIDKDKYGA